MCRCVLARTLRVNEGDARTREVKGEQTDLLGMQSLMTIPNFLLQPSCPVLKGMSSDCVKQQRQVLWFNPKWQLSAVDSCALTLTPSCPWWDGEENRKKAGRTSEFR